MPLHPSCSNFWHASLALTAAFSSVIHWIIVRLLLHIRRAFNYHWRAKWNTSNATILALASSCTRIVDEPFSWGTVFTLWKNWRDTSFISFKLDASLYVKKRAYFCYFWQWISIDAKTFRLQPSLLPVWLSSPLWVFVSLAHPLNPS